MDITCLLGFMELNNRPTFKILQVLMLSRMLPSFTSTTRSPPVLVVWHRLKRSQHHGGPQTFWGAYFTGVKNLEWIKWIEKVWFLRSSSSTLLQSQNVLMETSRETLPTVQRGGALGTSFANPFRNPDVFLFQCKQLWWTVYLLGPLWQH